MSLISSTQIGLRLETHWPVSVQLAPVHTIRTVRAGWTQKEKNANDG